MTAANTRNAYRIMAAWTALALFGLATPAAAQDDQVPRVLPFEGRLEHDGVPLDGLVDMRFRVFDSGGTALWSETRGAGSDRACSERPSCQVDVRDGRFSVLLGEFEALDAAIFEYGQVEVEIGVRIDGEALTTLQGRVPVRPVPYSLWTASGTDLTVNGDVQVDGQLELGSGTVASIASGSVEAHTISAGSISTLGVSAGADLRAANVTAAEMEVGSRVFLASDGDGSGYEAMSASGDALTLGSSEQSRVTFNPRPVFVADSATVQGSFPGAALSVRNASQAQAHSVSRWEIPTNSNLVHAAHFDLTEDAFHTTDLSPSNLTCIVGGVRMTHGDICENGNRNCLSCELDGDDDRVWDDSRYPSLQCNDSSSVTHEHGIFMANTYQQGNTNWRINAEFLSHNEDENIQVGLICFRNEAVRVLCPNANRDDRFWPDNCAGTPWFVFSRVSAVHSNWPEAH